MAFFGLPLLVGGGFMVYGGINQVAGGSAPSIFHGDVLTLCIIGAVMMIVGASLLVGGLRWLRGGASSRIKGQVDPKIFNPLESPWFPKRPGTCVDSPSGAVILNTQHSVGAQIGCVLIIAAIWGAFTLPAFVGTLGEWTKKGDFVPLLVSSPFMLVLVALLAAAGYLFMRKVSVGRVSIEVEHEPFCPGESVAFRVLVSGSYPVDSAKVTLICQERVQYRQGTDTRTERHNVREEIVAQAQRTAAQPGQSIMSGILNIPPGAPLSFTSNDNHLEWSLEVVMDIPGLPDVKDAFPFRVLPPKGTSTR